VLYTSASEAAALWCQTNLHITIQCWYVLYEIIHDFSHWHNSRQTSMSTVD